MLVVILGYGSLGYARSESGVPHLRKQGSATHNRGWAAVPGAGGRIGKQHSNQSREHAADMAQTRFGPSQLRLGGRIVGADGTG